MRCRQVALIMLGVLLALSPSVGASADEPHRFDGVTLRIGTYGGNWREIMERGLAPRFAALGGKLEIISGNPQANLARLIASHGSPPFDIMDIADSQVAIFQDEDYLAVLDPSRLPSAELLRPGSITDKMVSAWTSQGTICFNTEKFSALGLPAPTTYKNLIQPSLAGKVMIPDLNSGGGIVNIGAIVVSAGGDETDIGPGLDLIKRMAGVRLWTQGDQVVLAFQTGDILAAVANSGWCLNARKAGIPVRSVAPVIKPGVVGVENHGWLGVMKTSSNVDAAYWFLDAYLGVDYQLAYALGSGQTPDNRLALAKMGQNPMLAEMIELDPAVLGRALRLNYRKIDISAWGEMWNRQMTR